jgi:hypothetical protein
MHERPAAVLQRYAMPVETVGGIGGIDILLSCGLTEVLLGVVNCDCVVDDFEIHERLSA